MSKEYIWNPKVKGSGLITCIPQSEKCPQNCPDCFFQSGRSYLEPLEENLPHIPPIYLTKGRIVRVNDGNDSNVQRETVERIARQFRDYFFNTSIPKDLQSFSAPVVLTVNPANLTDLGFHRLTEIPSNLMYIRIRVNMWNLDNVVKPAVGYYSSKEVPIILTFMAYYTQSIPEKYKNCYEWKKRTINSYWVLKQDNINEVINLFQDNSWVYTCGYKGQHACRFCGNCIREYYNTKERNER